MGHKVSLLRSAVHRRGHATASDHLIADIDVADWVGRHDLVAQHKGQQGPGWVFVFLAFFQIAPSLLIIADGHNSGARLRAHSELGVGVGRTGRGVRS